MRILINYFMMAGLLVISASLHAASLSVPNTFSSGTPAVAAEVNDNFAAVKTAVDDNDSRLSALEAAVTALQSTVSSQAGTITVMTNNLTAANNAIGLLQAGKADVGHNHDASYSSITHNHVGVYAPVNHGHVQADISGLSSSLSGKANTSHNHAQSDVTGLTSSLSTHTSQISAINNSSVMDLDAYLTVSRVGGAKVTLRGINLQIINGLNANGLNGLGNLIIGYDDVNTDETRFVCSNGFYKNITNCENNGGIWSNSHKTGSHNLVLGSENSYSSIGGMVGGYRNFSNRPYSSVSGGSLNVASGFSSSISGGRFNYAAGSYSSISGGEAGSAGGLSSSVSGGRFNGSSGSYSSVSGGYGHKVSAIYDWSAGSLFEDQ